MEQIYLALFCLAHDKYLVEKTTNPEKAFQRHVDGVGGTYTQVHTPYCIMDKTPINTQEDIDKIIDMYKKFYGENNICFYI